MSVDITRLSEGLPAKQQKMVRQEYRQRAKNPTTAFLLCFFLGIFGAHCFYLGRVGQGVLRLVLSPLIIPGLIWEIFDLFRIDHEVYEGNLKMAEQLVAGAMLSLPNTAAESEAIAQLDALVQAHEAAATQPASAEPTPTEAATATSDVVAPEWPTAAASDVAAAEPAHEEAPPIWPVAPAVALAADAALAEAQRERENEQDARAAWSAGAAPAEPTVEESADAPAGTFATAQAHEKIADVPVSAFTTGVNAPAEPVESATGWSQPAHDEGVVGWSQLASQEAAPVSPSAWTDEAAPVAWVTAMPAAAPEEMPAAMWVPPVPPETSSAPEPAVRESVAPEPGAAEPVAEDMGTAVPAWQEPVVMPQEWAAPAAPELALADATPPVWEQAAPAGLVWASAEEAQLPRPAPAMADTGAMEEPVDHWTDITAEMVALAAAAAEEEAPLGRAEPVAEMGPVADVGPIADETTSPSTLAFTTGVGLAAAGAIDLTDRAADVGDPGQMADIGEGAGGRVRVTLPSDTPAETAVPAGAGWPIGGADVWQGGAPAVDDEANPLLVLIPEEKSEPVADGDSSTTTAGGLAAGLGAAALLAGAGSDAGPEPIEPAAPPQAEDALAARPAETPAEMPAGVGESAVEGYQAHVTEEEHEQPAAGARRVVKRVRVVRRLMVNGQVVQEASAEQVVDADADTAATAASLQQTLGSTDPETLAALAANAGANLDGEATPPAPGTPGQGTSGSGGTPQAGA